MLIVDDDPRNVKLLEALLGTDAYRLFTALNAEEALAILEREEVQLLLTDVMMPKIDGFELTRRVRSRPRTRLLPIVLITALQEPEDRVQGIEAGCDDFISKPFDEHEVLARVKTLLTLSYYRSLLDEKDKLTTVLDGIEDGIVVLDGTLRPTQWNQPAQKLLRLDADKPSDDFLPHLARHFTIACSGSLATDLLSGSLRFEMRRPESQSVRELILEARSQVLRDPDGAIASIVLLVRDVTEARIEEFAKQEFLSLISHKLRTPLAVISANASVLGDGMAGPLNAEQSEMARVIVDKTQAIGGLVGKLLEFTMLLRSARQDAAAACVLELELPALIDRLVAIHGRGKQVHATVECRDPEATIVMNRLYFDAILGHLVENAIKFCHQPCVELAVTVERRPEGIAIHVADNGPGIPPEERDKVFTPFYQVEKYFTGNVQGVGLGLSLVKRLMENHGGVVTLESALGSGTHVTLRFPDGSSRLAKARQPGS